MAEKRKKKGMLREVITGPRYDLKEFIVPASDTKGHSVPIGLRCVNGLMRDIHEVLAARKFPYKTVSDVLRHGIYRHIQWLKELEPSITAKMDYTEIIINIAKTQHMHLRFLSTIREVESTVSQLVREGMRSDAKAMVRDIINQLDAHPSNDTWKKKLTKEVEERFGHLFPGLIE